MEDAHMPMYEYRCSKCGAEFEELVFGDEAPACPACHAQETEKLLSRPCRCMSGGCSVDPAAYARAAAGAGCGGGCGGCSGGNCASCHG